MVATILHVTTAAAWQAAQRSGLYAPPELARDGFLHLCTPAQLAFVLARHFPDRTGLLLLEVDAEATGARLEWADSEAAQPPFPHLHGPIPTAAVRSVRPVGANPAP